MITAEIKEDGKLIGHLLIDQVDRVKGKNYYHRYDWTYYRVGDDRVYSGEIQHLYSSGIECLTSKCLDAYFKEKNIGPHKPPRSKRDNPQG